MSQINTAVEPVQISSEISESLKNKGDLKECLDLMFTCPFSFGKSMLFEQSVPNIIVPINIDNPIDESAAKNKPKHSLHKMNEEQIEMFVKQNLEKEFIETQELKEPEFSRNERERRRTIAIESIDIEPQVKFEVRRVRTLNREEEGIIEEIDSAEETSQDDEEDNNELLESEDLNNYEELKQLVEEESKLPLALNRLSTIGSPRQRRNTLDDLWEKDRRKTMPGGDNEVRLMEIREKAKDHNEKDPSVKILPLNLEKIKEIHESDDDRYSSSHKSPMSQISPRVNQPLSSERYMKANENPLKDEKMSEKSKSSNRKNRGTPQIADKLEVMNSKANDDLYDSSSANESKDLRKNYIERTETFTQQPSSPICNIETVGKELKTVYKQKNVGVNKLKLPNDGMKKNPKMKNDGILNPNEIDFSSIASKSEMPSFLEMSLEEMGKVDKNEDNSLEDSDISNIAQSPSPIKVKSNKKDFAKKAEEFMNSFSSSNTLLSEVNVLGKHHEHEDVEIREVQADEEKKTGQKQPKPDTKNETFDYLKAERQTQTLDQSLLFRTFTEPLKETNEKTPFKKSSTSEPQGHPKKPPSPKLIPIDQIQVDNAEKPPEEKNHLPKVEIKKKISEKKPFEKSLTERATTGEKKKTSELKPKTQVLNSSNSVDLQTENNEFSLKKISIKKFTALKDPVNDPKNIKNIEKGTNSGPSETSKDMTQIFHDKADLNNSSDIRKSLAQELVTPKRVTFTVGNPPASPTFENLGVFGANILRLPRTQESLPNLTPKVQSLQKNLIEEEKKEKFKSESLPDINKKSRIVITSDNVNAQHSHASIVTQEKLLFLYYLELIGHPNSVKGSLNFFYVKRHIQPLDVVNMNKRLEIRITNSSFSSIESDLAWIGYLQIAAPMPSGFNSQTRVSTMLTWPLGKHPGDVYFKLLYRCQKQHRVNELKRLTKAQKVDNLLNNSWGKFINEKNKPYYYNFLSCQKADIIPLHPQNFDLSAGAQKKSKLRSLITQERDIQEILSMFDMHELHKEEELYSLSNYLVNSVMTNENAAAFRTG